MDIKWILDTIKSVTNYSPVVRGGNQSNPIEYSVSQLGYRVYRLELYINGSRLDDIMNICSAINNALVDFGDNTINADMSIDYVGGGSFANGNRITQACYYQVVSYEKRNIGGN